MCFTLKQARILQDISMEEMGEKLNMHPQTYSKIEKNPRRATIEQAEKICEILNKSFEEIFFTL